MRQEPLNIDELEPLFAYVGRRSDEATDPAVVFVRDASSRIPQLSTRSEMLHAFRPERYQVRGRAMGYV